MSVVYRPCRMNCDGQRRKVILELLYTCNLRCEHCSHRDQMHLRRRTMMPEESVYEAIGQFAARQVDSLVLTGGEPTLHPAIIEISEYAMAHMPRVSLCTNGCILSMRVKERILDLRFSGITVSVDSYKHDVHDSFRRMNGALRRTIEFLEQLALRRRQVTVHVTVHRGNLDHIEDTVAFCRKLCSEVTIGSIHDYPSSLNGNDLEVYRAKLDSLKAEYLAERDIVCVGFDPACTFNGCPDGTNLQIVDPEGKTIPCCWRGNLDDASPTS